MDEYIFDEHDEIDTVILCSEEKEYKMMEEESMKPVSVLEDYVETKSIDCTDIDPDEADVSPVGSEAELYIEVEKELLSGDDEDSEIIDLVGGL